jgi:hypothetical protein
VDGARPARRAGAGKLAEAHDTRCQWEAITEPTRRLARAADIELKRRRVRDLGNATQSRGESDDLPRLRRMLMPMSALLQLAPVDDHPSAVLTSVSESVRRLGILSAGIVAQEGR